MNWFTRNMPADDEQLSAYMARVAGRPLPKSARMPDAELLWVKAQMLRRAGFSVYEAATGQSALDSARDHAIDLVVLDVNLPDMSGFEVCRQLRARQPGPPAIQILHVSSTAVTDNDRARGLNEGADAYLAEPLEQGVLVATVQALLRVRRAEASLADALTREHRARTEADQ